MRYAEMKEMRLSRFMSEHETSRFSGLCQEATRDCKKIARIYAGLTIVDGAGNEKYIMFATWKSAVVAPIPAT
jgi:hypothetical protein